jgi:hypothetical protein
LGAFGNNQKYFEEGVMSELKEVLEKFERMAKKNKNQPLMVSRQKVPELFPGLSPKSLANWHSQGIGPPTYKKGRIVFYKVSELVGYLTDDE